MRSSGNHGECGPSIGRIVSGGQTGADRAALDYALAAGIPHAGWCPRGRMAEDGRIDSRYRLAETPDRDYAQRTEWNARDSDGTVIFSIAATLSGGSAFTRAAARRHDKPCLCLSSERFDPVNAANALRSFVIGNDIDRINIAGPRASSEPGIGAFVRQVLEIAFGAK